MFALCTTLIPLQRKSTLHDPIIRRDMDSEEISLTIPEAARYSIEF